MITVAKKGMVDLLEEAQLLLTCIMNFIPDSMVSRRAREGKSSVAILDFKVGGADGFPSDLNDLIRRGTWAILKNDMDANRIPAKSLATFELVAQGLEDWTALDDEGETTRSENGEFGRRVTSGAGSSDDRLPPQSQNKLPPVRIDEIKQEMHLSDGRMIQWNGVITWEAFVLLWNARGDVVLKGVFNHTDTKDLIRQIKQVLCQVGLPSWAESIKSRTGFGWMLDLPADNLVFPE